MKATARIKTFSYFNKYLPTLFGNAKRISKPEKNYRFGKITKMQRHHYNYYWQLIMKAPQNQTYSLLKNNRNMIQYDRYKKLNLKRDPKQKENLQDR